MTDKSKPVQVILAESVIGELNYLKESMGLPTASSVVRRAIRITRDLMREAEDGGKIIVRHKDGTETKLVIL